MRSAVTIAAAFVLVSCTDQKAWIQKFVPKDDDAFARRFVEAVSNKRYEEAKAMLTPDIRSSADSDLPRMQPFVDHGQPQSFESIACTINYNATSGGKPNKKVELTYQLHFTDAWALVDIIVQSSSDGRYVGGAHFYSLPDSLAVLNRFTFENKTAIHYVFFAGCILVPLFIIVTVIICIWSRIRRRWLWVIFILFGLMQFQLNWTSGQISVQPISFVLLGASYFRPGLYGPFTLSVGLPAGAIIFLLLKSKLRRKDQSLPAANNGSPNAVTGN